MFTGFCFEIWFPCSLPSGTASRPVDPHFSYYVGVASKKSGSGCHHRPKLFLLLHYISLTFSFPLSLSSPTRSFASDVDRRSTCLRPPPPSVANRAFFRKNWHFLRHGTFSFVNENAIKLVKNAPFCVSGIFSESPYVVKTPFGAFFHGIWGIFSFRG